MPNTKRRHHLSPLSWFILLFSVAVAFLFFSRGTNYYPQLSIAAPEQMGLHFLLRAHTTSTSCETTLARLTSTITANCPTCTVEARQCITQLSRQQERLLSDEPIGVPSAHMPDGVITYTAPRHADALAACEETQRRATHGADIRCYAPDTERRYFAPKAGWVDPQNIAYAFLLLIFAQLVAKLVCFLIIRYEHVHAHLSHDTSDGPQKFHAVPTPRIGGVALMMGLLVSSAVLLALPQQFPDREFGLLLLSSLPAFLGGLTEDITKKVGVSQRLILTMVSAGFCAWLLGATLDRVDVPGMDTLMAWTPFALAFTVFAVAGATNSINIIDGYNGLAAGFGVIVLTAMAFISAQLGDTFLLAANLAMAGSLLGFLVWNWPGGKIFLGDGGAYLLGFWISEMSVLLLVRHPEVTVWFPLLLMIYPVFETLFSMYRRKIKRNAHPGHPDATHLHQLIYCRLVRVFVGSKVATEKIRRNSRVAYYPWGFTCILAGFACLAWDNTRVLAALTIGFCVFYVWLYGAIVNWKSPGFLFQRLRK